MTFCLHTVHTYSWMTFGVVCLCCVIDLKNSKPVACWGKSILRHSVQLWGRKQADINYRLAGCSNFPSCACCSIFIAVTCCSFTFLSRPFPWSDSKLSVKQDVWFRLFCQGLVCSLLLIRGLGPSIFAPFHVNSWCRHSCKFHSLEAVTVRYSVNSLWR